jgi:hypothetical protein
LKIWLHVVEPGDVVLRHVPRAQVHRERLLTHESFLDVADDGRVEQKRIGFDL